MANPLKWVMELVDKMSGPAHKATKALEEVEKHTKHAHSVLEEYEKANARAWSKVKENVLEGVTAYELAKKGVELVSEAMHEADFERTSGIAFKALAGSAEEGERILETAKKFAKEAHTPIEDTIGLYQTLLSGGIKGARNLTVFAQAATDIAALSHGTRSAQSVAEMFARMNSEGIVMGRQLRSEAANLNLDMGKLAKRLGTNVEGLRHMEGIKAPVALKAFLDTLQEKEGGVLGQVTKDIGEGWGGAITNLQNSWKGLLAGFEKSPVFPRLIGFVNDFASKLEDPLLLKTVSGLVDGFTRVADVIGKILPSVQTLYNLFGGGFGEKLAGWMDEKMGAGAVKGYKLNLPGGHWKIVEAGTGKTLSEGFDSGVNAQLAKVGVGGAQALAKGFSGPKGIDAHSPSKLFERYGSFSADGFSQGLERGGMGDMLSPPTSPSGGARPGHGARVEFNQTINVSAGKAIDEKTLAEHLKELTLSSLQSAFDQLALTSGTA